MYASWFPRTEGFSSCPYACLGHVQPKTAAYKVKNPSSGTNQRTNNALKMIDALLYTHKTQNGGTRYRLPTLQAHLGHSSRRAQNDAHAQNTILPPKLIISNVRDYYADDDSRSADDIVASSSGDYFVSGAGSFK
jgi:hypothetical protein